MRRLTDSMRGRVLAGAAALLATASLAIAQGPPPAMVRVDAARQESLMVPRSVTGEIVSLRRSLLASQVEGFVVELSLNEGDAVEKGAVIARLDTAIAELEVTRAKADLEAARGVVMEREAELERFGRDLARTRLVIERGSATESALDAAEADVRTTEALLMQARALVLADEARLALAERRLEDKTIRAPFDGRVVRKEAELGEWVTPGDTIVEIVSLTELEARIDVPEHLVSYLTEDLGSIPLTVPGLGAASDTTARVIAVVPLGDSLSRMFPVRLAVAAPHVDGRPSGLRPGMSVTASVPTGSVEPVLTIHKDAVLRDDAGLFAYMAVPFGDPTNPGVTGQAVPARISRLFAAGDRVAIRPGQVRAGSWLLVEGNERVFPTQPLVVQDPPGSSPFAGGGGRDDDGERPSGERSDG